jgi:hypothetical protein
VRYCRINNQCNGICVLLVSTSHYDHDSVLTMTALSIVAAARLVPASF